MHRLILPILLILPLTLACSRRPDDEAFQKAENLLAPNTNYIILLEQITPNAETSQPQSNPNHNSKEYILIQGRDIKHFTQINYPAISRHGHLVAENINDEIIVYMPDENEYYILNPPLVDKSEIFTGGYAISPGGNNVYRLAINQLNNKGGIKYTGSLIEFDIDHKRDVAITTIFELNEEKYKIAEEIIRNCFTLPLYASEKGDYVFYCSRKFEEYKPPPDPGLTLGYGSISDVFVKYDYYIYNKEMETYETWYASCEANEYMVDMAGISADGHSTLFLSQRPNGVFDLRVQSSPGADPDAILTEKLYELFHPRISPEGARAAYSRRIWSDEGGISEAVMMRIDSRREEILFRLKGVSDLCWTDDVQAIAYISKSNYSSLIQNGKEPPVYNSDNYFLHIVNTDKRDDNVIFRGAEGKIIRIVNILATPQKFEDSSDKRQTGNIPQIIEEKGEPKHTPKRKVSQQPSIGPSLSTN